MAKTPAIADSGSSSRPEYRAAGLPGRGQAGELALPHVLAAWTGDGFRGFFLFHGLATNRTIFAPHGSTFALL